MPRDTNVDIAVIGAGSGGLSVAAGAVQMGASVLLVEKGKMGGDCLNYGCVPSKALLAAGHAAHEARSGGKFGVFNEEPKIDFTKVHEHVHNVIAAIEPNDSVERFEGLGVKVIQAAAQFVSPNEIQAGEFRIKAKRFVVATGSSATVPPIPGIEEVTVFTNETIFDLTEQPEHLVIIGGGPIGMELAQAHRRLGCKVTVLEMFEVLAKDDREAADIVRQQLIQEGVGIRENIKIERIESDTHGVGVFIIDGENESHISGTHLLVAAGRKANVEELNLTAANVEHSPKGIKVDARLRSTNQRVYAVGDVAGSYQFTHIASYHAGIVIRNILFKLPAKVKYHAVPWVTFTDPEIAHVGADEKSAREKEGDSVKVTKWPYQENDRAQAEQATQGFVKVITGRRGRIRGTTIVGKNAGELIQPWVLAIDRGLKIGAMAGIIAPYPTLGEVNKRVAGSYYTDSLFSERTRRIVRFLMNFS